MKKDRLDWIEIIAGDEMSDWIKSNNVLLWKEITYGLYLLHPKLYVWWKLKYR